MTVKVPRTRGAKWEPVADSAYEADALSYVLLWGEEAWAYELRHPAKSGEEGAYEDADGTWYKPGYRVQAFTHNPISADTRVQPAGVDEYPLFDSAEDYLIGLVYDHECANEGHAYAPTKAPLDKDKGGAWTGEYTDNDAPNLIACIGDRYLFTDDAKSMVRVASMASGKFLRVFHGSLRYSRACWWACNVVDVKEEQDDVAAMVSELLEGAEVVEDEASS